MTQPIRFFFDECISRSVVEGQIAKSLSLYTVHASVMHLFSKYPRDKYPHGVKDRAWIPELAGEGGWVIITMDRGKHSRKSESLPIISRAFRITHIMLSAGLAKRSMYYRALAIEACWPNLMNAAEQTPGAGFILSIHETPSSDVHFRLRKKMDALSAEDAPEIQRFLFDEWSAGQ